MDTAPSCDGGQMICSGRCVDSQTDRDNCGMCGNACAAGLVCDTGMCVPSCRAGQTNCMGSCTSTETDPNHCGMCGNICGPYTNAVASCATSACIMTCNAGFNDCDGIDANGCECRTANIGGMGIPLAMGTLTNARRSDARSDP